MLGRIASAVRNALRRLRASIARAVVETVEVVVNGVRTVLQVLSPRAAAPELEMEAAEVVAEEPLAGADNKPIVDAAKRAIRDREGERVRLAAKSLHEGRRIPVDYLDPDKPAELEVLAWLADRSALELGVLAKASPAAIEDHLNGRPMPMVKAFGRPEAPTSGDVEAAPAPSEQEWYDYLLAEAVELSIQIDGGEPDFDKLEEDARRYAEEGISFAEYEERFPILSEDADVG